MSLRTLSKGLWATDLRVKEKLFRELSLSYKCLRYSVYSLLGRKEFSLQSRASTLESN